MKKFDKKELLGSIRMPAIDWNMNFFGGHQQTIKKNWHYPSERHLAFETFYIISGSIVVDVFDNKIYLNSGDIMILSPNVWHETVSLAETTYFNFHFNLDDDRFVKNLMTHTILSFPVGSIKNTELVNSIEGLRLLLNKNMEYSFVEELTIQKNLLEFLVKIFFYESSDNKFGDSSQLKIASSLAFQIQTQLKNQIHAYFNEDFATVKTFKKISINTIYQELKISPSYGGSIFKNIYGYSPRQYLTNLKISQSKRLLKLPDVSVSNISNALGYNDSAHFTRQFKRWTNETPLQFRKKENKLDS